jgi:ATP-dependent DNA helicase PIF1
MDDKKDKLDPTQQEAVDLAEEGSHVFLTGSAGVGKSFVLAHIMKMFKEANKKVAVTASTGIAAVNINGVTLYNYFKLHPKMVDENKLRNQATWVGLDVLIIDEVSMVPPRLFAFLNRQAQLSRKNKELFGGVQLILSGDMFQLPPIMKGEPLKFIFETELWKMLNIQPIQLTTVHRQDNADFIAILDRIRKGVYTQADAQVFSKKRKREGEDTKGIRPTKLYCLNRNVDSENKRALIALSTEQKQYTITSKFTGDKINATTQRKCLKNALKNLPVSETLLLKIDAQVMLTVNLSVEHGLANGSRGIVVAFEEKTGYPIVQFKEHKLLIRPYEWMLPAGKKAKLVVCCIPLKLAWALSVHKSQGQSITHLEVDLSNVFTEGQAYVALSRATSLDDLVVKGYSEKSVRVHPRVLEFYNTF